MKKKKARRKSTIAEISALETIVEAVANSFAKKYYDILKRLYFARHPGQIMIMDEEDFKRSMQGGPLLPVLDHFLLRKPANEIDISRMSILNRLFCIAVVEAYGDADKTRTIFMEMFHTVPLEMNAFVDGIKMVKGRRAGGKANKMAKAVMATVQKLVNRAPRLSANTISKLFPPEEDPITVQLADGEYEVYRDEESEIIVQVNPKNMKRYVSINSLKRYVTQARKKRKKKSDPIAH